VAIQPSKREPCNTIKEVTESTDFNCQRANLVQLWLCITLNNILKTLGSQIIFFDLLVKFQKCTI